MTDVSDILKHNEETLIALPEKPQTPKPKKEPEVIEPLFSLPTTDNSWFEAKKEFLMNPDIKVTELAKKYNIQRNMLIKRIDEEGWEKQRTSIFARADAKMQGMVENTLAEVKSRHALIGKMLQKVAVKSIKSYKQILTPRDAVLYMSEGVRLEREAHGMGKDQPKIVNIITQQQAIIDKYRVKNDKSA